MEKKQLFNLSYILMAILGVLMLQPLLMGQFRPRVIPYSEFVQAVMVEDTFFQTLLSGLIPIAIFYFIWFFLMRRMQAGAAGMMTLGKNKAKPQRCKSRSDSAPRRQGCRRRHRLQSLGNAGSGWLRLSRKG